MAEILHFPPSEAQTPEEFINETRDMMAGEDISSVIIVAKNSNGEVTTGYYQCDFSTRLELSGHIQCDIIDQMIRANPERYRVE